MDRCHWGPEEIRNTLVFTKSTPIANIAAQLQEYVHTMEEYFRSACSTTGAAFWKNSFQVAVEYTFGLTRWHFKSVTKFSADRLAPALKKMIQEWKQNEKVGLLTQIIYHHEEQKIIPNQKVG